MAGSISAVKTRIDLFYTCRTASFVSFSVAKKLSLSVNLLAVWLSITFVTYIVSKKHLDGFSGVLWKDLDLISGFEKGDSELLKCYRALTKSFSTCLWWILKYKENLKSLGALLQTFYILGKSQNNTRHERMHTFIDSQQLCVVWCHHEMNSNVLTAHSFGSLTHRLFFD